jgi:hypothetical protein
MLNQLWRMAGVAMLGMASIASAAEITMYERENLRGRSYTTSASIPNLVYGGFNDRADSIVVRSGSWQVCTDADFRGRCLTLTPGEYASLRAMGLTDRISSVRVLGGGRMALYDQPNFGGRGVTLESDTQNFGPIGINDRAMSAIVYEGTWQVCEHADFSGTCITLAPGRYGDLGQLDRRVSSARIFTDDRPPRPAGLGARAVLFEGQNLTGRSLALNNDVVDNLATVGFNDRASSLRVERGYWIFCTDANFQGECRTFGPGDYPTLPWDLNNRISSGRRISGNYPYNGNPNWSNR